MFASSDHLLIKFSLTISDNTVRKARNFRLGAWNSFQMAMARRDFFLPHTWMYQSLAMESSNFIKDVQNALNASHPPNVIKNRIRPLQWWNKSLTLLKQSVKAAFSIHRKLCTESTHDGLVAARRLFKKAAQKAKRRGWQQFLEEATDLRKVSQINKIVQARDNNSLGMLRKEDGSICKTLNESINRLVEVHFPGLVAGKYEPPPLPPKSCDINDPRANFITEEKNREAIKSFGYFKAPGPDGIPPIVYKHLDDKSIIRLKQIFKASYLLGCTPGKWRAAKVIFIAKDGKKDYAQPRSFRPITLSNFLVKIMERVVLWHINQNILAINPLSANQHAFRKGYSTESALSSMVGQIEGAFAKNEYALGVFLDIQGAFDNVRPESIIKGMMEKDFPSTLINWYEHYLCNRTIHVSQRELILKGRLNWAHPREVSSLP